jgi:prophage regulatory protein
MTMAEDVEQLKEMLNSDQVLDMIPISRTTLFRMERNGLFPQGQSITPHRKLWWKHEVVAWQKALQDPESELSKLFRAQRKRKGKGDLTDG